jgi:hypothetical protein
MCNFLTIISTLFWEEGYLTRLPVSRLYNVARRVVSRQRFGKHVPAVTDTHATIEVLLETVFSTRSMQRGYKEEN